MAETKVPVRILFVEDSPSDLELILRAIRKGGLDPIYRQIISPHEFKDALKDDWHIILSDYFMPGFSALEAKQILDKYKHEIPFVVVSGAIGEETAVEMMRAGAKDFIMKDNLSRLVPVIQREVKDERERRLAKDRYHSSEMRLALSLEAAKMGVWEWNSVTDIVTWSEIENDLFGFPSGTTSLKMVQLLSRIDSKDLTAFLHDFEQAIQNTGKFDSVFQVNLPEGCSRWLLGKGMVYKTMDETRIVGINMDITKQKENEIAIQENERKAREALISRDEFISIASHELKTPLTSLLLQLQMGLRELQEPTDLKIVEKLRKKIELSLGQVGRLNKLVEDLLDASRIRSGNLSYHFNKVNLAELVQDVKERLCEQTDIVSDIITLDISPDIEGLWDRSRLEQVLINLMSNSFKYAVGSPISISAKIINQQMVEICYEDKGPGIAIEKQAIIFDRFERAIDNKEISGLGLGLYIVRQLVLGHKGSIRLESDGKSGSCFIIQLPLIPQEVVRKVTSSIDSQS